MSLATADPLDCALDLMRRLPPQKIDENLAALTDIVPNLADELLSAVDQPLRIRMCKSTGREYLLCDYNRDGDSYRSPWSNEYDPPLDDGVVPSANLRRLEQAANDAFDTYREMYYDGGVSSVYLWDLEDGFAAVILIKKAGDVSHAKSMKGAWWDSIHVFEVHGHQKISQYKLTSTVMLYLMTSKSESAGNINLSGNMTRQVEQELPLDPLAGQQTSHIINMGRMVEDMEFKIRHSLQDIYFGKTKDIVNDLRSVQSLSDKRRQDDMQKELAAKLMGQQFASISTTATGTAQMATENTS